MMTTLVSCSRGPTVVKLPGSLHTDAPSRTMNVSCIQWPLLSFTG